jgi:hypothetical protein
MALNVETTSSHSKKSSTIKKIPSNGLVLNVSYEIKRKKYRRLFLFQVEIYNRDEIHFSSGFPCTISEVRSGVGASCTRPMPGDVLLQVNDINVSRTQAKAVKKLIRFEINFNFEEKKVFSSFKIEVYLYPSIFNYIVVQILLHPHHHHHP